MTEWTKQKSKLIALYNKNIDVISIDKQLIKNFLVVFQLRNSTLLDQSKNQDDEIINQEFESEIADDNHDEENKINDRFKGTMFRCKNKLSCNANDMEIIHSPQVCIILKALGRLI